MILMSEATVKYHTDLYRQTCECMAGQYGRWCKHLTELQGEYVTATARIEKKIADAKARWDREAEAQRVARAREVARDRWSASYPGTD